MTVWVYWITKDLSLIHSLQASLGMPQYLSINGETPFDVKDDATMQRLKKGEELGYLQIRIKKI